MAARRSCLFCAIALLMVPCGATAWETRLNGPGGGPGAALTVAVDGAGDVVAGGHVDDANIQSSFIVVKLAAIHGNELWRRVVTCDGNACEARGIAFDGGNDVFAVGVTRAAANTPVFTVLKLARDTGSVLWRSDVVGGVGNALVVDSSGDAIAAGWTADQAGQSFTVVKLRGTDGGELWRATVAGGQAMGVVRTAANDVVAAGLSSGNTRVVVRLAGATGAELWRSTVPGHGDHTRVSIALDRSSDDVAVASGAPGDATTLPAGRVDRLSGVDGIQQWTKSVGRPSGVAVRDSGDVVVADGVRDAGPYDVNRGNVFVCARGDGAELWRRSPGFGEANPSLDAAGNVVAATLVRYGSVTPDGYVGPLLAVTKLSGVSGADVWRRTSDPKAAAPGGVIPFATAVGPTGAVIVAGIQTDDPRSLWFVVLSFDGSDGSLDVCGDAVTDAGEQCDDGNHTDGDCCGATCRGVAADGFPCGDDDACTITESCRAGSCIGAPLPCEPCGSCDPALGCRATPSFGCRPTTVGRLAVLDLRRPPSRPATLAWRWEEEAATAKDDFGDPRAATGYALCVYSRPLASTPTPPILALLAPAGGTCGGSGCWRATRRGFAYRDRRHPARTLHGLSALTLRGGATGGTRIGMRGSGPQLGLPRLPLPDGGVTVQLKRTDSPICWSADETFVVRNRRDRFTARDD